MIFWWGDPSSVLNEYFIELNTANFKILNTSLNWIFSENWQMNQIWNWILSRTEKWINIWIEFCRKTENWINIWIEFCQKTDKWIVFWIEFRQKMEKKNHEIWEIINLQRVQSYDTTRLFVFNSAFNHNALPNMHHYPLIPLDWEVQRNVINSCLIMG